MSMKVKQIFNTGIINYKDKKTGESKVLHKCTAFVSGETGFMHTFVSDREIQVGDSVAFAEWVLAENVSVNNGTVRINLSCEPAGIVKMDSGNKAS